MINITIQDLTLLYWICSGTPAIYDRFLVDSHVSAGGPNPNPMHHRFPRMRDPTSAKCRAKHSAKIGRWLNLSVNFGENGLKGKRYVIELVSNALPCGDCQDFSNHFKHDYDNDDCWEQWPWCRRNIGHPSPIPQIPCGKRLHNYGKSPCYSWVNPLFLWSFSIANC